MLVNEGNLKLKIEMEDKEMKEIIYVTGNESKIFSAKEIFEPLGFKVDNKKISLTEIQADDVEDVAKHKAKEASEILKNNVLINDTGLFVESLGGFPGPYTHYADDKLGEDGLLKLLEGVKNRNAYFKEAFAYCEYGKDPIVITALTKGVIAKEKSGEYGFSWDFIFIPEGKDKTMGCYPDEKRCLIWNTDGYYKLAEYLKKNQLV